MKKKYFAISSGATGEYKTKKEMLKDLKNFMGTDGKGHVFIYFGDNIDEITSEDNIGEYVDGKMVYIKPKKKY